MANRRCKEKRLAGRTGTQALHVLHAPGWEERLAPLAQHMAAKHLVRARGQDGAPLRRLDLRMLRDALNSLLHEDDDDGYLVYQLVVEGADPAVVVQERGTSRPALVEQLRDAVAMLAVTYEDVADPAAPTAPSIV